MAKGWRDDCGISDEGVEILGWVEALPRDARRELAATVEMLCRAQGYVSLNDEIVVLEAERSPPSGPHRMPGRTAGCTRRRAIPPQLRSRSCPKAVDRGEKRPVSAFRTGRRLWTTCGAPVGDSLVLTRACVLC